MRLLSDEEINVLSDKAFIDTYIEPDASYYVVDLCHKTAEAQAELTRSEAYKAVGEWLYSKCTDMSHTSGPIPNSRRIHCPSCQILVIKALSQGKLPE
jgi:hypothetical protein